MGFGDRSGFACPRGPAGTHTAAIATQEMRSVLQRPEAGSTDVTFQAGATITEVVAFANANSLTLPLGTLPGYSDLTLGGLLSTGGHINQHCGVWHRAILRAACMLGAPARPCHALSARHIRWETLLLLVSLLLLQVWGKPTLGQIVGEALHLHSLPCARPVPGGFLPAAAGSRTAVRPSITF